MPHPKRKISKSRRDKRRTHVKAERPEFQECRETGEQHMPHRATVIEEDGKKVFVYNGRRYN